MAGVHIPRLREKLDTLSGLGGLHSRSRIAATLNVAESTLRYWINGDDIRQPGMVPNKHIPTLIRLLCETMPGERSEAEARNLLLGPLDDFAAVFAARPEARWPVFLDGHAQAHLTVIPLETLRRKRGPAYIPPSPRPGETLMQPGSRFRISFKPDLRLRGQLNAVMFQHDNDGWDCLSIGVEEPLWHGEGSVIDAPVGTLDGYELGKTVFGQVTFVALACCAALPDDIKAAAIETGRLVPQDLDRLADMLLAQPTQKWSLARTSVFIQSDG
ncbi:MAG: hypothetical protein AAF066_02235 [Pseudomonadota bacterium]